MPKHLLANWYSHTHSHTPNILRMSLYRLKLIKSLGYEKPKTLFLNFVRCVMVTNTQLLRHANSMKWQVSPAREKTILKTFLGIESGHRTPPAQLSQRSRSSLLWWLVSGCTNIHRFINRLAKLQLLTRLEVFFINRPWRQNKKILPQN